MGIAVIMRDISAIGTTLGPFQEMAEVIDYIFKSYRKQIIIDDLAKIANLSTRQLERRFKKLFGLSPIRYINEHRIRMACTMLRQTQKNIAAIAKEVGFYDHAHFVHKFRTSMKIAPSEYRAKY
ncbi:MAG: AraC family transcriptional regulator [Lentisphaeraceae bacterium]|nr:AraC family transcriptional regulator [Lentisphaeraceae bacterium]